MCFVHLHILVQMTIITSFSPWAVSDVNIVQLLLWTKIKSAAELLCMLASESHVSVIYGMVVNDESLTSARVVRSEIRLVGLLWAGICHICGPCCKLTFCQAHPRGLPSKFIPRHTTRPLYHLLSPRLPSCLPSNVSKN